MQVARREMKPAEEVEDEMGDWSQAPEISGCSPLHLAAHNGRLEHLEELLSSGAAVNATDNYNETPLHMAARGGYVDICDVLLHYGADPRVLNKNQKTPLLLAALSGHADVCDLLSPLKLARRPPPKGLITAEKEPSRSCCWSFCQDSSSDSTAASTPRDSVEEDCSFGCNDLHWAALRCSLADLHAGLAKGILVDTQDPWGDTALHLAARAGSEEICSVLCAAKANPLVLNKDKKTALEVARIGGHLMIADLLEDFCLVNQGAIRRRSSLEPDEYASLNTTELQALAVQRGLPVPVAAERALLLPLLRSYDIGRRVGSGGMCSRTVSHESLLTQSSDGLEDGTSVAHLGDCRRQASEGHLVRLAQLRGSAERERSPMPFARTFSSWSDEVFTSSNKAHRRMATAGGGACKFAPLFRDALRVELEPVREMRAMVDGFLLLAPSASLGTWGGKDYNMNL
eukprot:g8828.t1